MLVLGCSTPAPCCRQQAPPRAQDKGHPTSLTGGGSKERGRAVTQRALGQGPGATPSLLGVVPRDLSRPDRAQLSAAEGRGLS